ncbi:hypothetical protein ACXET9_07185 [Brachybacterium sp. DNPG3]
MKRVLAQVWAPGVAAVAALVGAGSMLADGNRLGAVWALVAGMWAAFALVLMMQGLRHRCPAPQPVERGIAVVHLIGGMGDGETAHPNVGTSEELLGAPILYLAGVGAEAHYRVARVDHTSYVAVPIKEPAP